MSKKIACPKCGGTTLSVRQEVKTCMCYTIEDNKLYSLGSDNFPIPIGSIWITCLNGCEDEYEGSFEWRASSEQARMLRNMFLEPRCADITEYMADEQEHD